MSKIVQIVAHQDDDLLFMSPFLLHALEQGDTVDTLYLTAGDDGQGSDYWGSRMIGAEDAYAVMLDSPQTWTPGSVSVAGRTWLTSRPSTAGAFLTFALLPDGNVDGSGFPSTGNVSLHKLLTGDVSAIADVGHQHQTYTGAELITCLEAYLTLGGDPDVILLQDWVHYSTPGWSDHSDHMAGAVAAVWAAASAGIHCPVIGMEGYQVSSLAPNVSASDLTRKTEVFAAYCEHDNRATVGPPYDAWLARQETVGVILL